MTVSQRTTPDEPELLATQPIDILGWLTDDTEDMDDGVENCAFRPRDMQPPRRYVAE